MNGVVRPRHGCLRFPASLQFPLVTRETMRSPFVARQQLDAVMLHQADLQFGRVAFGRVAFEVEIDSACR